MAIIRLAPLACLVALGCLPEDGRQSDLSELPGVDQRTCASIGSDGGTLQIRGGQIVIPVGALIATHELCMTERADPAPVSLFPLSRLWEFEPHGLQFTIPARVTLPFVGGVNQPAVYWTDGSEYVFVGGAVDGDTITVMTSHFSTAVVSDIERVEERYSIPPSAMDILFIVDTSGSMSEEQELLATGFQQLFDEIVMNDFHVGVVSTNMDLSEMSGRLQADPSSGLRWVEHSTPDANQVFRGMALMGTDSHYYEKGRAAAYTAIELLRETENAGFFRDHAELHIVVISDEDDYSERSPIGLEDFIDYLEHHKPGAGMVSFSSIVGPDLGLGPTDTCQTAAEVGSEYLAVTHAIGGVEGSVCDLDYGPALTEIGQHVAGFWRHIFLSSLPVVGSIEVTLAQPEQDPVLLDRADWVYDELGNYLLLTGLSPESGAWVTVSYVPRG